MRRCFERGIVEPVCAGVGQADGDLRQRLCAALRRQHQCNAKRIGDGAGAVQRLRVSGVARQQNGAGVIHHHLGQRFQQARAEAGVEGTQHRRGGHRAGGDAPVAGGGVMHRIVKAGRGDLPVIRGEHFTDGVTVFPVAARRGKHAGQAGRVESGRCDGFQPGRQGEFDDRAAAPAFCRGQQRGWRQHGLVRLIGLAARRGRPGCSASRSNRGRAGRCLRCRR